jgi:hypothetical protein
MQCEDVVILTFVYRNSIFIQIYLKATVFMFIICQNLEKYATLLSYFLEVKQQHGPNAKYFLS